MCTRIKSMFRRSLGDKVQVSRNNTRALFSKLAPVDVIVKSLTKYP